MLTGNQFILVPAIFLVVRAYKLFALNHACRSDQPLKLLVLGREALAKQLKVPVPTPEIANLVTPFRLRLAFNFCREVTGTRLKNSAQIPSGPNTASKSACLPSLTQNLRWTTNRGVCCHFGAVLPCVLAMISSATERGASSYLAKCIEYSARPWVDERICVA